jgi:two-component system chemotaxis response regulator CheB
MKNGTIGVLIVDDSAVVRQALSEILSSDPGLRVIGMASDPYQAVERMREERPDVITLDIEMPRMDGLTFLEKIMSQHPIPVVICSSLTAEGSKLAMRALDAGAVEVIAKPKLGVREFFEETRDRFCRTIRSAALANLKRLRRIVPATAPAWRPPPKLSADAMIEPASKPVRVGETEPIVVIGASTGGTQALGYILPQLPADVPGIAIVQHMPEVFTAHFAERLDQSSAVSVKEAVNGDAMRRGQVLIAPGGYHLLLKRNGVRYAVEVRQGPLVNRHRPSVDVLFRSAARNAGRNATGFLLTGMGDDGARGLLEMRECGSKTIAQSEESCVVFGMPREAIQLDAAGHVMDLDGIVRTIAEMA